MNLTSNMNLETNASLRNVDFNRIKKQNNKRMSKRRNVFTTNPKNSIRIIHGGRRAINAVLRILSFYVPISSIQIDFNYERKKKNLVNAMKNEIFRISFG